MVQDPAHNAPFPRRQLTRPVDVRIPKMRGRRMAFEDELLGASDAVALAVLVLIRQRRIFPNRHRQSWRHMHLCIEKALIDRCPADREQPTDATLQHLGNRAQSPIAGDRDVKRFVAEGGSQSLLAEDVAVQMPEVGDLEWLMAARMQQRHLVTALAKALGYRRAGRPGATDQEGRRDCHRGSTVGTGRPLSASGKSYKLYDHGRRHHG